MLKNLDDTIGKNTYANTIVSLIGHLVGTGVIFMSFSLVVWCLAYFVHFLHTIHPFADETLAVIGKIELYSIYIDILLCGVVFIAGAIRFCKDIVEVKP